MLRTFLSVLATSTLLANLSAAPAHLLKLPARTEVHALAFSPDGKTLAIGTHRLLQGGYSDNAVELWAIDSRARIKTLKQKPWNDDIETNNGMYVVGSLQFSPDGNWLIATDSHGYILWDPASGAEKIRWRSGVTDQYLSPGWSADGARLALPSMEQEKFAFTNGIALIEIQTLKRTAFFPVAIGYARTARISKDGRLLATAGTDCTVRVFDLQNHTNIFEAFVQTTMSTAAISPDSRKIIAGSSSRGVLLLYDVTSPNGKPLVTKKGVTPATREEIHLVEFTPDGAHAFTKSHTGLRLWNTKNWTTLRQIPNTLGRLSPDGAHIALVRQSTPATIEVWRFNDLLELRSP
jgi:WD40 repeat protein